MMLDFVIDAISVYFLSGFGHFWYFYFLALLFVCTIPFLIRSLLRR